MGALNFMACVNEKKEERTVELLQDTLFENGFKTQWKHDDPGADTVIFFEGKDKYPFWQLAQWWSKYNIADDEIILNDDKFLVEDAGKKVELDRNSGTLSLNVYAKNEYDVPRPENGNWPHLLLAQDLTSAMNYPFSDLEKITASLKFNVTFFENYMTEEEKQSWHHGQLAWFINLKNVNMSSPGYNNHLWFGLNLYNTDFEYALDFAGQDMAGGPGDFIYTVGAKRFMDTPVQVGQEKVINVDIFPFVEKALEVAKLNGFMADTEFGDLAVTGMNIGWEVFGTFNLGVDLTGISIQAQKK